MCTASGSLIFWCDSIGVLHLKLSSIQLNTPPPFSLVLFSPHNLLLCLLSVVGFLFDVFHVEDQPFFFFCNKIMIPLCIMTQRNYNSITNNEIMIPFSLLRLTKIFVNCCTLLWFRFCFWPFSMLSKNKIMKIKFCCTFVKKLCSHCICFFHSEYM